MKPFILLVVCLSLTKGQLSPKVNAKPVKVDITPFDDVACSAETRPLVLSDPTGSFVSPNYPDPYANGANCWWLIVTDQPNHVIELDFDVFATEADYDGVIINDGDQISDPYIAGFDGEYDPIPTGVRSSGPSMLVRFVSDKSENDAGFSATYRAVPVDRSPDPCYSLVRPLKLTDGSGSFTSKGYPDYYWNHADCQWHIESQEAGGSVHLTFDSFSTEQTYDTLNIYDGDSTSSPLLASISGNQAVPPGPFHSTGSSLFLRFVTDQTSVDTGFSASYMSVPAK